MTTWFVSDLHFDHRNIIHHCKRPFASVEEMNESMIVSWNRNIQPEDTVYVVGDFSFSRYPSLHFDRLKGHKILIRGNHDHKAVRALGWQNVHSYLEARMSDGSLVCMCHFPIISWNQMHRDSYMFHGHCHGTLEYPNSLVNSRIFDVGVDNLVHVIGEYGPISWNQARIHLRKREFTKLDHHG